MPLIITRLGILQKFSNNTKETTMEEKNLANLIEMGLKRFLYPKIETSSYLIINRRTAQTTYEVNVSISNNIATVIIGTETQTTISYFLPPSISGSTTGLQEFGRFTMELGTDGMPAGNTMAMAKYLISLFKANPQNGISNDILLTNNMTKLQVRQLFKNVAGMTAVEDIFIGLPQAEKRQEIKDYVDMFFTQMMFEENSTEFTELAQITGADRLYEKLIKVLSDKSLKLKKTTFGPADPAGKYDTYWNLLKYEVSDSDSQTEKITNAKTLIHELLHAYVDIISGKPLGPKQDEAMAHGLEKGYFAMSTGIYGYLRNIENFIISGDWAEAINKWNILVNGDPNYYNGKPLVDYNMTDDTYEYKLLLSKVGTYTKEDFRRLHEYTGFGLSHARLEQVAQYLNTKYNTNLFKVQNNNVSY
jgi:hypothetical protein